MPAPLYLRSHVTGQVIDPLWGNYADRTLFLLEEFAVETAFILRTIGSSPDYMNIIVDLFFDSSVYDPTPTTAVVDTTAHITHLPGGFTTGVDYVYQTLEQTLDVSPAVAEFTIVHKDDAALTFTPKLSVVVSGVHTFVTGTLVITRDTDIILYTIFDDFLNLGQTNTLTTTAVVDTTAGLVKLPGSAEDVFVTPFQVTNNATVDWFDTNANTLNLSIPGGDSCVNQSTGDIYVVYNSFEFNASVSNIRFRCLEQATGTFRSYSGNPYVDVTVLTSGATRQMSPRIDHYSDGTCAIVWFDESLPGLRYIEVNPVTGTKSTNFSFFTSSLGGLSVDIATNRTLNRTYIVHRGGAAASSLGLGFKYINQGGGSATSILNETTGPNDAPAHLKIALDQQARLHVAANIHATTNGVNATTLRYNMYDFGLAAWQYGATLFGSTFTQTIYSAAADNCHFDLDVNENAAGVTAEAYLTYINATNVHERAIINGVAGTQRDVLLSATQQRNPRIWYDNTNQTKHLIYTDAVSGVRYNTLNSLDVLGTQQNVDASALDFTGSLMWGFQKLVLAYRRGTNNNTNSEVYVTQKPTGYTLLQKQWNSVKFPISLEAEKFLIVSDKTQTADHTIIYEITANATAGSPTYNTATLNVPGTFTVPGTQIALRVRLQTTNSNTTPTILSLRAYPIVPAKEKVYEFTGLVGTLAKLQVLLKSSSGAVDAVLYRIAAIFS